MVEKTVRPSLAKRLAMAAALTATLLNPVRDMVNVISPEVDIMEIACAPESTLTGVFEQHGYNGFRVNYKTGFNLDTPKGTTMLAEKVKEVRPRLAWISFRCTRVSSLQNLTERTPAQCDLFCKRRGRDLKRCDEIAKAMAWMATTWLGNGHHRPMKDGAVGQLQDSCSS